MKGVCELRVATHHLMDNVFFESKTSRPSVRPLLFNSGCVLYMYVHKYILHSLARPIGFQQTLSPHFTYLLTYLLTTQTGRLKGGSIMRQIPEDATVQERKRKRKRKKERHFFEGGGGIQSSGTILCTSTSIIQNLIQNLPLLYTAQPEKVWLNSGYFSLGTKKLACTIFLFSTSHR